MWKMMSLMQAYWVNDYDAIAIKLKWKDNTVVLVGLNTYQKVYFIES